MSTTPEYQSWAGMKKRCLTPNSKDYHNYGGRGIKICDRWMDFENFLADMGPRPGPEYTLERKDNNGNYEPGNCKWATRKEQSYNKRTNRPLTWKGRTQTIEQWADELGIEGDTIRDRLYDSWSIEKTLSTPVKTSRLLTFEGRTQTLVQWAEEVGIDAGTLRTRLQNNWSVEDALGIPLYGRKYVQSLREKQAALLGQSEVAS